MDTNFGRYDQGYGQMVGGRNEFFLIVPPVEVQFCLRGYPNMIDPTGGHGYATFGEGEVTARMGALETLELKVRAPADLTNLAASASEKKVAEESAAAKAGKAGR